MEFEFYERFAAYSTADLIIIVRQPDQYQAEAIAAAERILQERDISETDREQAEQFFRNEESAKMAREERLQSYRDKVVDFAEPLLMPQAEVSPWKWYRLFLTGYILIYIRAFYYFVRTEIMILRHGLELGWFILADFADIAYLSVVLYLLVKKNRWGWILLFVGSVCEIAINFIQLEQLYKYRGVVRPNVGNVAFEILFPILLVFFLWKRSITDFFRVDAIIRKRSLLAGVAIGVVYCVAILIAFG